VGYKSGRAFDEGRVSDFDVALAGPDILARARAAGVDMRSGGTRTAPLTARDLRKMGLHDLARRLRTQAGREVNFMIYADPAAPARRSTSVVLPRRRRQ
jgi:filamentous hemagglutinin